MTIEEYKKLLKSENSPSKYHNKKVTFRGELFDSIKERDYYILLLDRQKRGEIKEIKRQVPYTIVPDFTDSSGNKHKALTYIADFVYTDSSGLHIVDTKGYRTEVYKIKKKLLAYKGIIIEEV